MKIKQQKQIRKYLIEEFGLDKGNVLFDKQEKMLDELIKNAKNKSENQIKTLVQTILPRIALYKAMLKSDLANDEIYKYMRRHTEEPVKYIVCNGDEGDPGAFMVRSIMEGNPHSVLEGMMIAGAATGATDARKPASDGSR